MSELARDLLPPIVRRWANRLAGGLITLRGPYRDWLAAKNASAGYDREDILARVTAATESVLAGNACYEQDGVAITKAAAPSHALTAMMLGAALDDGRLSVADFGGGLASLYLRWRRWLAPMRGLRWCVIEQPQFVSAGRRLFAGDPALSFSDSIESARAARPNVVIASSVLQYLSDPIAVLRELITLQAKVIVIDRTPYDRDGQAAIVTQHVPKRLGAASYPQWIFARESINYVLRQEHDLLMEFPTMDATLRCGNIVAQYRGSVWLRRGGT